MTKKDFSSKQNPAMKFMTVEATNESAIGQPIPSQEETNHQERKTRRLNLIMQPSVMDALMKIAYMQRSSINDLINNLARDYTQLHTDTINRYDAIFENENT